MEDKNVQDPIMSQPSVILVVDDEANFREIFSAKLGQAGFKVETAESALAGIEKAKRIKPDLILLDIRMPEVNGVDAMMRIKEDPSIKDIKVVFLTSAGDPQLQAEGSDEKFAVEIGASGYVRKTDDLDAIVEKIKSYL